MTKKQEKEPEAFTIIVDKEMNEFLGTICDLAMSNPKYAETMIRKELYEVSSRFFLTMAREVGDAGWKRDYESAKDGY